MQYLVLLECHFLWQVQHVAKFWERAGARNVVFFHAKCVAEVGQVSSANGQVATRSRPPRGGGGPGAFWR